MKNLRSTLGIITGIYVLLASSAHADYGTDRALIEDLQARYLFAFDFGDPQGYAGTFTEDGILNFGWGDVVGREAISSFIEDSRIRTLESHANVPEGQRPNIGRHIINNIVVEIDGDTARGAAYWTHMSSDETGYGTVDFFGHYEDEMLKVDGQWLFTKRYVYNEAVAEWASNYINPVTHPSSPPKERPSSQ